MSQETRPKTVGDRKLTSTPGASVSTQGTPRDNTDKSDKKREATSPLYDTDSLQEKKTRHNTGNESTFLTHDDLTMRGMDVDTSTGADIDTEAIHLLPQPMQPMDILQIATSLRALMLPEIKQAVSESVKEATTPLIQDIKSLREDVDKLQKENADIKATNANLEARLAAVEYENDSLEQYSRRNSLRISGIPEDRDENTDHQVLRIAEALGVNISRYDIDRSHRVGKLEQERTQPGRAPLKVKRRTPRDILVKLARYNVRDQLYLERKELRDIDSYKGVFINEDLTRKRSKLLYDARTLARAGMVKAAYSGDGRLYIRDTSDTRHLIKTGADIATFGDVDEVRKMIERTRLMRLGQRFAAAGNTPGGASNKD